MERIIESSVLKKVKPIRDIVYELLRKAILDGKIKPGERIVENDYAEMFHTSRTPIREALRKLEMEGFVEYLPRKGVIVKGFSLSDIIEIYEIRKSLECLAIRHVVAKISGQEIDQIRAIVQEMEKADQEDNIEQLVTICQQFHDTILHTSSMPRLTSMINTLQDYLERFKRVTLEKLERRGNAIKEHQEIFRAIDQRDVNKAEELISQHIEASKRAFLEDYTAQAE